MKKQLHLNLGFPYILLSLIFQSMVVVIGKFASLSVHSITIGNLLLNPFYMLSLGCLFLQAIVWQQALRYYPLSWAYMFMSGVYPVIMLSSYFLFHEQVTSGNIAGTLIILIGIYNLLKSNK